MLKNAFVLVIPCHSLMDGTREWDRYERKKEVARFNSVKEMNDYIQTIA